MDWLAPMTEVQSTAGAVVVEGSVVEPVVSGQNRAPGATS